MQDAVEPVFCIVNALSMAFWLFKTEPVKFSFDDLENAPNQTTTWDGIRNYRARNFLRDDAKLGDQVLFYHSRSEVLGIVGTAEVVKEAYPDHTAWDPKSDYYDPKASPENPRWMMVDVKFGKRFPRMVTLEEIRNEPSLADMLLVKRCQRLSIQPVEAAHFQKILQMGGL